MKDWKRFSRIFSIIGMILCCFACLVACEPADNQKPNDPVVDPGTNPGTTPGTNPGGSQCNHDNLVWIEEVAATETTNGMKGHYYCETCGKYYDDQKQEVTKESLELKYVAPEWVDYVSQLKLDMDSNTKKAKATVKAYIDGDTTHFNMPAGEIEGNVLKARYLAINTPESTGQIEEWGKASSRFTKEKLMNAESIIIESDNDKWNLDSTGGRYLVWIWYRTDANSDYRNLNLEILQNGLAIASNTARNRYGDTCVKALTQAKTFKLKVFSGEQDPDFYYGDARVVTLTEIRANIQKYEGTTVSFDAVVTKNYNNALYVEQYDDELQMYVGMYIYLGYGLSGKGLSIVEVGNYVRFVGSLQYYETGGTYQLADLKYQAMRPNDPTNIKLIEEGHSASFLLTDPATFANGKVTIEFVDEETEETSSQEYDYAYLALNTSVEMKNLVVKRVYTTTNEESSSKGAMTLTCEVNGITIKVRTVVLYDESGNLVTADAYEGKTIDVKGFIDYFDGEYQIKIFSTKDINIH